jgi:hypothetical protein
MVVTYGKDKGLLLRTIVFLSVALLFAGSQISSAIRDASSNNNIGINNQISNINNNLEILIETLKENK